MLTAHPARASLLALASLDAQGGLDVLPVELTVILRRARSLVHAMGLLLLVSLTGFSQAGDTGAGRATNGTTVSSKTSATTVSPAPEQSEYSIDSILSGAYVAETAVSRDGSLVAYTVMRVQVEADRNARTSEICVANPDGTVKCAVGADKGVVSSPRFSPDGSRMAFLAPAEAGDLEGTMQVYVSRVSEEHTEQITQLPNGVVALEWSPADDRLALVLVDVPQSVPGPEGAADDAIVAAEQVVRMNLWVLDARAEAEPVRLTDGDYRIEGLSWSPDGQSIAFTHAQASQPEGWHVDVSIVDVEGKAVVPVAATPAAEMQPVFSPDGLTIAFIRGEEPTADFSAWRMELVPTPGRTGGIKRTLGATWNEMPMPLGWSADGEAVFFEEAVGTAHVIAALPVSGEPPMMLTPDDAVCGAVSLSADGSTLVYAMQDFRTAQEAYTAPATTKEALIPRRLSGVNQDVVGRAVPKVEVVSWTSPDGMDVEGILTYPLGYEEGESYPLVLSIHGGPAESFSQSYFGQPDVYPYATWAAKGYAVLRPNPRGSTGYGADFRKANIADWGGGPYTDLMAGVDKVIDMGLADPNRLAVVGWSYGGYMTANITTRTDRFKVAVVGAGPVDLVSQMGTTDLPDMVPAYMGGHPWEIPDRYQSQSPIFGVGRVRTPTLILHGTDDTRVPYSQAQQWHAALRVTGVACAFVSYPRSGHVVQEPQLMKDLQIRVLEWVDERLESTPG